MAGLASAWKNEAAFRQETILAILLIPAAFWLGANIVHTSLLLLSVFIVLITELLNSSIEATIDRISEDKHELSKRAKDVASAAVFISLLTLIIIWGLAIFDKFFT